MILVRPGVWTALGSLPLAMLLCSRPARAWVGPECVVEGPLTAIVEVTQEQTDSLAFCMAPPDGDASPSELVDDGRARRAYENYVRLSATGRYPEALLQLGVVEYAMPRIADRVALWRGDLLMTMGEPAEACSAYATASASPETTVQMRGQLGSVRCLLAAGDRRGIAALTALTLRYRNPPELVELRYELGALHERLGDPRRAAAVYRTLDIERPGHPVAARARERLGALADAGVQSRPLTAEERVTRAEHLVRQGPMSQAALEIESMLEEQSSLPVTLRPRLALIAGLMAKFEGRWQDAQHLFRSARVGRTLSPAEQAESERQEQLAAEAARAREQGAAERLILAMKGRRPYSALTVNAIAAIIREGSRAGLKTHVDGALEALARRRGVPPNTTFQSAIAAAGVGDDTYVAALLSSLRDHRTLGVAARYHHARALERLALLTEASREYESVIALDRSVTRYYAMWSEQRMISVTQALACNCVPNENNEAVGLDLLPGPIALASNGAIPDLRLEPPRRFEAMPATEELERMTVTPTDRAESPDTKALAAALGTLLAEWAEPFPWLARAHDLLLLGEANLADDEIHEAYLAWRDARGTSLWRVGLESIYRGDNRLRRSTPVPTRRARTSLSADARDAIARVARALGDDGIAVALSGPRAVAQRPRAYEALVNETARKYGIDPNLLLAVMRVESVYQRRIISYAGAVGLMQIMPRTGWLIANRLGRDEFSTEDLLDPATNLEFAAWYLASLLRRFDGRLPLAIASYNGGPHNVRKWLRESGEQMPMDAFLERIPFDQTHRYVRRVLTHYAAYRAQQGMSMERLDLTLPVEPGPDPVAF